MGAGKPEGSLDTISSSLVDAFYKDDDELKHRRRVTAIVGASYLLHLRATDPDRLTEAESRLLESLLSELGVPEGEALELLKEIEERGAESILQMLDE